MLHMVSIHLKTQVTAVSLDSYGNFCHIDWGHQSVFLQHFPPFSCYHYTHYSPSQSWNKKLLWRFHHWRQHMHWVNHRDLRTKAALWSLNWCLWCSFQPKPCSMILIQKASVTSLTFYLLSSRIFSHFLYKVPFTCRIAQEVLIRMDRKGCWGKIWWKYSAHHFHRT